MIAKIYSLNIDERKEFIKSFLKRRNIPFMVQPFQDGEYGGENIIVEKWVRKNVPNIIITAHYDGWGAYDNAGGTAGLLWLLHWAEIDELKSLNENYGLIVAFLDGEEKGLLGVKAFIKNYLPKKKLNLTGQISLDGFGIGTHIGGFANTEEVKLRINSKKEIRFKLQADTSVFQKHSIPSLHLFSLPHQELKGLIDKKEFPLSWKILHTKEDTPDRIEEVFLPFVIFNLYKNIGLLDFRAKGTIMIGDTHERG